MGKFTIETFKKMFPKTKNPQNIFDAVNKYMSKYEINTVNRLAGFLAQCGHESGGFTIFKENLNYSAEGLQKIFKKYFPTAAEAAKYARNPEKIANKVYANRMGNGSETSGDGWKYAGKGAIQLTGKSNYEAFAKSKQITLDEASKYLTTIEGAIESALWYWGSRGLNATCDKDDIVSMTKKINGGTIGLEDRKKHYQEFKHILHA